MKYVFSCVIAVLLWFGAAPAAPRPQGVEYFGKLNPQLEATSFATLAMLTLKPASASELRRLPRKFAKGDRAFAGTINWRENFFERPKQREKNEDELRVVLIEPAEGTPYIYADTDFDGVLKAAERFFFTVTGKEFGLEKSEAALLQLPLPNSTFRFYPMFVIRNEDSQGASSNKKEIREMLLSINAIARGIVNIEGRPTLVQYTFNPATGKIDPRMGFLGIDGDGDGRIDRERDTLESVRAAKETIVFRVGDRYVSTKVVDMETREIVLTSHPASDYTRIELRIGTQVPDFPFTDLDGRARKLSDFRGKYVMLEFWGTWCKPCVEEIPHLKEAYTKYRSRGFEILGMNNEVLGNHSAEDLAEGMKKVKTFVAEKEVAWTQATTDSIKDITEKRFRVSMWPTSILLDPQGKIVSLYLKGEELQKTLDKLLPAAGTASSQVSMSGTITEDPDRR